ncbi:MAG: Crp/Fnr family transcriptional regulator [Mycobacteriales bacterium]|nr:Crp/Fnr family transcriptional regulator [Frankia sp.]
MTETLAKLALFADLDEPALRALDAALTQESYPRGREIFHENDDADRLFVVLEGKVKITRSGHDERENLLAVLGPGDIFGELSLFDLAPRTATATALTKTRVASLQHERLRAWLTHRPEVGAVLLRVLAARLRRTNEAMADLVFTDVPGRVAKSLLDLAERFGEPTDAGIRVAHDLTQEELAQLVGASRETVNKALGDFAARGWLRVDSRAVTLLDRERLARRGG